jgi:hypothetical protein
MKLATANKIYLTSRLRTCERASIRIILLALCSFFLGVAATIFCFHLAAKRSAQNPVVQASAQSSAGESAAPVANAAPPAQSVVATPQPMDPAAITEVKRTIPNYASLSLEAGTQILRQAALKKFASAAKEMESQVANAQAGLSEAENSKSASDQQAAMKRLQQTQTAQTEKLQQIAAQLQAQIAALKQLKNTE